MVSKFFAIAAVLAGLVSIVAFADDDDRNTDCYFQMQAVERSCSTCSWHAVRNDPERFHTPLNLTSATHYEYADEARKLSVSADLNREAMRARLVMITPDAKSDETVKLSRFEHDDYVLLGSSYTDSMDDSKMHAYQYRVSCSFGLSDRVKEIKAKEERDMDRMGPSREWTDPAAASIGTLPVGTILEVSRDFVAEIGDNVVVEYNGPMTNSAFDKIELQYRYAYIKFSNANNGYLRKTPYGKGIKMRVESVEYQRYSTRGGEYRIGLKPVADGPQASDPITYLIAVGRRGGRYEMKLPQFIEMLKPIISVQTP